MFYYKFNLLHESLPWYGSKACKKKYFKSPQWLRSIKNKKYSLWRMDILFSKKKYNNINFINDGGWHFTNIRKAEDLNKKLLNFLHHVDFETSGLKTDDLERLIRQKKVMYNHSVDKKGFKWSEGENLKKIDVNKLPKYIIKNIDKFKEWIES
jgi:beta-1,4-mannosyl-glycoprotein beta-1,4-N-acetylglucosaminyltransferase